MNGPNPVRRAALALMSAGLVASALNPSASAQLGNVDQFSLRGTSGPAVVGLTDSSSPGVQQQVTAGSAGKLTGVEFLLTGNQGEAVAVRVRRGTIPSSEPVLWKDIAVAGSVLGWEVPLLDTSAAGIVLAAGEPFVLEFQVLTDGVGLGASIYTPPCYPHPLHPGAPAWPNLRLSFRTFMSDPAPGASYCIPSPNSSHTPARIWASGSSSIAANDIVLHAGPMPDFFARFFYGLLPIQHPFGNGFLCVGNGLGRLPVVNPRCGTIITHFDLAQVPPQVVAPGTTLYMQAWFRDPYHGPFTFGFSDGYSVTLTP